MICRPISRATLATLVSVLSFGLLSGQEYEPRGKRDPFVRSVRPQVRPSPEVTRKARKRPTGLAGLYISEVEVVGTAQKAGTAVVILKGPNDFSYVIRPGAKLMDGYLESAADGQVVFALEKKRVIRHLGK